MLSRLIRIVLHLPSLPGRESMQAGKHAFAAGRSRKHWPAVGCRESMAPAAPLWLFTLAALLLGATTVSGQAVPADQAAEMLLTSARTAYNNKDYPFAAGRFREFLAKYGSHKEVNAARYGLALSLIEGPDKDYNGAVEQLNPLAGVKDATDYPFYLYYLGLAQRGQGVKALAQIPAKPNEAPQLKDAARQRFDEAAKQFAAAVDAFAGRAKNPDPEKDLPLDLEWSARARCDLAEMLLRNAKPKEARDAAAPFASDKLLAKSRYHGQGLYYHGFACFQQKDEPAAGRSLSQLAPFSDPVFGTHARYLMARVHHAADERAEAAADYQGVLDDHAKQKVAAAEALKQPDRFKNDPDEKARLEALTRDPVPDHVARAAFFLGVMQYEDGKFAEALAKLAEFVKQNPTSPLAAEAQLRQGFCQVQLKQWAEAQKILQPLSEKEPRLADQCLLWIAKSQVGAADPNNAPAFEQALKTALDTFRRAAEKAGQMLDAEAKARRGEILFETADAQQLAKQFKEAAATYTTILNDKLTPTREEEAAQGVPAALQLAGDYAESDKACQRFRDAYPKSPLLPAVSFRFAENACFSAQAAEKLPNPDDKKRETAKWYDEALKRYQTVVDRYPESPNVNLARYGLAMCHYHKGDLERARAALETIAGAERTGDLAVAPYHLADCLIRLAPIKADDAVAAGKLEEQLKQASELLSGFVAAQPDRPQAPDALIKLGFCQQRLAGVLAQGPDQAAALAAARTAYEQLLQKYAKSDLAPQAKFERAKVLASQKDVNGAVNELRQFAANDPWKAAPSAPMALLHLATLLRGQNQAQQAADVLAQCRKDWETKLQADPARAGWVPLLQYHHGVALREAGKRGDARAVFDLVVKQAADRPEAGDAALRFGQCLKDDGQQKMTDAAKKLATSNLKPEEIDAAKKLMDDGVKDLRDAVQYLTQQAEALKQKQPTAEARGRMFYEAAWACRTLADLEITAARDKILQEQWQKRKDEVAKKTPPGRSPPFVPPPDVPLAAVPPQPSEGQARAQYQALIAGFPDLPLATDARFELAEVLTERGEHDGAVKLLNDALDKEPTPELAEKIKVRLGAALLAKGDAKKALDKLTAVANNPKSAMAPQAAYRAGECQLALGKPDEAAKALAVFRDKPEFQNVPNLTDRALLRLGAALSQLKQWDASRQAYEQVFNRFGNSPWANEARYGAGWCLQNQQKYDEAVNYYNQVTANTATELAARAQLSVGQCRLAQKKYAEASTAFLIVPTTYDYPSLSATALLEAARVFTEDNKAEQAVKLLERVTRDHPDTEQAEAAKKRLAELKKG
jgi:TolA-binding protein